MLNILRSLPAILALFSNTALASDDSVIFKDPFSMSDLPTCGSVHQYRAYDSATDNYGRIWAGKLYSVVTTNVDPDCDTSSAECVLQKSYINCAKVAGLTECKRGNNREPMMTAYKAFDRCVVKQIEKSCAATADTACTAKVYLAGHAAKSSALETCDHHKTVLGPVDGEQMSLPATYSVGSIYQCVFSPDNYSEDLYSLRKLISKCFETTGSFLGQCQADGVKSFVLKASKVQKCSASEIASLRARGFGALADSFESILTQCKN